MNRAEEIVYKNLINPFLNKEEKYIGAELEFPICFFEDKNPRVLGENLLKALIENNGFTNEVECEDNSLMRIRNSNGDCVSFDYSYMTLEFSMSRSKSIKQMAERFFELFKACQEHYNKNGCIVTGMGSNFKLPTKYEYLNDPLYSTLREYIKLYTKNKNESYMFTSMQAIQTHIDVNGETLVEKLNLLNALDFVRGLLFSNSLPVEKEINYPDGILCARDFNWEFSEHANTGICDKQLNSINDLVEYMTFQKIFMHYRDNKLNCFKPISLKDYFENTDNPEEDIRSFRSFDRVAITQYHTLEMRGDCTQPLSEVFVAVSFNLGIVTNYKKAKQVLDTFLNNNNIKLKNSELRYMAITGQEIVSKEEMKKLLKDLVDIAKEGLEMRNCGEEEFILPLYDRVDRMECPALKTKRLLESGKTIEEIIIEYSKF